jgi:hypothetical protein
LLWKYSADTSIDSSSSDAPPLPDVGEVRKKLPVLVERDCEKGKPPVFERISEGFESTIEMAFADFFSGEEPIAALKPWRKTVCFSVLSSSTGSGLGPESAKEFAVSHSQKHEVPADPTTAAFNFREILQSSD